MGEGAYRLSNSLDICCYATCGALQYTAVVLMLFSLLGITTEGFFSIPVYVSEHVHTTWQEFKRTQLKSRTV